jgi:hypothetical protein
VFNLALTLGKLGNAAPSRPIAGAGPGVLGESQLKHVERFTKNSQYEVASSYVWASTIFRFRFCDFTYQALPIRRCITITFRFLAKEML